MRRATVLFEVVLSLALFAGAAAFALSATRSVFRALEVSHREQVAVDLASSTLARLEAGLVTLADLQDQTSDPGAGAEADTLWTVDAVTRVSPYTGLTLATVTVRERAVAAADRNPIEVTIRQLVRLREIEAAPYQEDPLLEDLPDVPPEPEPEPAP